MLHAFAGAEVEATRPGSCSSPLFIAAAGGHLEVVQLSCSVASFFPFLLVAAPQNIVFPKKGSHFFSRVAEQLRQCLLGAGAPVDEANQSNRSPLFAASLEGHTQVVHCLLGARADMNKATSAGRTPLFAAAEQGSEEVLRLLLHAGADSSIATIHGDTPLFAAASEGHAEVVHALLHAANVSPDRRILIAAAEGGHTAVLQCILQVGDAGWRKGAEELLLQAAVRGQTSWLPLGEGSRAHVQLHACSTTTPLQLQDSFP